jgi:hypothetical protein
VRAFLTDPGWASGENNDTTHTPCSDGLLRPGVCVTSSFFFFLLNLNYLKQACCYVIKQHEGKIHKSGRIQKVIKKTMEFQTRQNYLWCCPFPLFQKCAFVGELPSHVCTHLISLLLTTGHIIFHTQLSHGCVAHLINTQTVKNNSDLIIIVYVLKDSHMVRGPPSNTNWRWGQPAVSRIDKTRTLRIFVNASYRQSVWR